MGAIEGLLESQMKQTFSQLDDVTGDDQVLNMEPHVKPRPR